MFKKQSFKEQLILAGVAIGTYVILLIPMILMKSAGVLYLYGVLPAFIVTVGPVLLARTAYRWTKNSFERKRELAEAVAAPASAPLVSQSEGQPVYQESWSDAPEIRSEMEAVSAAHPAAPPPPLHAMGSSGATVPRVPQAEENSVLRAPQVSITLGRPSVDSHPSSPAPIPAMAPAAVVPAVKSSPVTREKSSGMRKAEAACWALLVLCLAGSLLGNALLGARWRADVEVKQKRWLDIDRMRQSARAAQVASKSKLQVIVPQAMQSAGRIAAKADELRAQNKLETEIKYSIVVLEQKLMDAGLMPRAPVPTSWPSEELDGIIASKPPFTR